MDVFKQNKILFWVIIILVVINLGTIAGMWIFNFGRKPHHEMLIHHHPMPDRKSPGIGRFEMLGTELKFNEEQMIKFNELRAGHQQEMKNYADKINGIKKKILADISMSEPDTAKADELFIEIGHYQTSIEKEIFNHFRRIKMICNDEQKQKLNEILKDIAKPNILPPQLPPEEN